MGNIKIAIYGYGNLGRGVECASKQNADITLTGIYTRRNPKDIKTVFGTPVYSVSEIKEHKSEIDVLVICGGSATDLPKMTPELANDFCVIDSFDTHAKIPEHFNAVDTSAKKGGNLSLISCGWDPGLFSVNRLYASSVLPDGEDYTFWGRGVSQGHSDAIRRIDGVIDARQYTVPIEDAVERVKRGEMPKLSIGEKHLRECYVVAEENADKARIEKEIKEMPNYFADYTTTVTFISQEEMKKNHSSLPHGGMVIRTGKTGEKNGNTNTIEYKLTLDSNPEFTSSVIIAYCRALKRKFDRGERGCITVFDVSPSDLSPLDGAEIRAKYL
ncbi:MAG: diaminopimelate dehydrogenase [Clostridia bacterium]|nr:diaminopimelate dehydrogenase [Clostridia bacterium]